MTEHIEQEATQIPAQIIEGPFIINLSAGEPKRFSRWTLGGGFGANLEYQQALGEISQLPEGLSFEELEQKAGDIFKSHKLLRIAL